MRCNLWKMRTHFLQCDRYRIKPYYLRSHRWKRWHLSLWVQIFVKMTHWKVCFKRQMTTWKIRIDLLTITTRKTCFHLFADDDTFFRFTSGKDHTPENAFSSFCRWQRVFHVRYRPMTPVDVTRFLPSTHSSLERFQKRLSEVSEVMI